MASLTIKGIPNELMDRLRKLAEKERRSLNQQVIVVLEQVLEERPTFSELYKAFKDTSGPSPFEGDELEGLRSPYTGRRIDL